jgi:ATP-dependent DNA helicase RecQ
MSGSMDEARRLLRHHFGHGDFRPAQQPVIASVLAGRDTLAVLPTGGGKSVCFQVPALVAGGLTLVVSPLIALMQDQVAAASARGIPAAALHSAVGHADRETIRRGLADGSLRLLYVSPEGLTRLAPELQDRGIRPALLAVDEAHCIAEWGHDFRPSYRTLGAARYRLGRPPAVALTGSATPDVRRDIARALPFRPGRDDEQLGSCDRANLWFGVVPVASERARLEALVGLLADDDRMVIVYAPTRSVTEAIARALAQAGHRAAPYHAGLRRERRSRTLEAFLDDRLDVIVATCAFGMGIDKPRIRLVVHWTLPPTPEAYYQEAGRAGRDGEFARCVLLWRAGDAVLHRRQLDVTFPPRALLERIWREGERCPGVPANVRASAERLRHELRPEQGAVDWSVVVDRRRRAEARIAAVEEYARGRGCRRRTLLEYFGERLERCSGCDRCRRRTVPVPAEPEVSARLTRLGAVVAARRGPWGAPILEPEVMLALARQPPVDGAALADVPGVGSALAERWGGAILGALRGPTRGVRRVPEEHSASALARVPGTASAPTAGQEPAQRRCPDGDTDLTRGGPRRRALEGWRNRVAVALGVPRYVVLRDAAVAAVATCDLRDGRALAALPGLGPRTLAKHGEALLALIAAHPPDHYLLPMDQGDAEILERIDAGQRVFRPGGGEQARPGFEALVAHLRDLRDRGLIDMPERSVAHAADEDTGAYLFAGPCFMTDAGREALREFRRGDRRVGERRGGERRASGEALPLTDTERRHAERRQGNRRNAGR